MRPAIEALKRQIKATPLAIPYIALANALGRSRTSQSDEAAVLQRIVDAVGVLPRVFIEFGFSGWEFNCIRLAQDRTWQGLLIDGDGYNVTIAKTLFHSGVQARSLWITLETLREIEEYALDRDVGVLSVDVDGNDYWFLQRLIRLRPTVVCAEVNVTFGLHPVTVVYDPAFDRTKKHETWQYFGASLAAMHLLCSTHGYSLVAMSGNGVNAFFVRNDALTPALRPLTLAEARRPQRRPDGSVVDSEHYWQRVKEMPFVDVTDPAHAAQANP